MSCALHVPGSSGGRRLRPRGPWRWGPCLVALALGAAGAARANGPVLAAAERILPSTSADGSLFGAGLAVSGDTLLAGDPFALECDGSLECGAAFLFVREPGTTSWTERVMLPQPTPCWWEFFGVPVALEPGAALVSGSGYGMVDLPGSVYPFEHDPATGGWVPQTALTSSDPASFRGFGTALGLDADALLIGTPYVTCAAGYLCGVVEAWARSGPTSTWQREAVLRGVDTTADDHFGAAVAVGGHTGMVGAPWRNSGGFAYRGAVYVFGHSPSTGEWVQVQVLTPTTSASNSGFGNAIVLSGDTAVIGAQSERCPQGQACGAAYVFERSLVDGTWSQRARLTSTAPQDHARFGAAVALYRGVALVGAPREAPNSGPPTGAVYVYSRQPDGTWILRRTLEGAADPTGTTLELGSTVALTGYGAFAGAFAPTGATGSVGVVLVFRNAGEACADDAECLDGHCVRGRCCASACDGLCERCDAAGDCVAVPAGEDPFAACPGAGPCKARCDGARACHYPDRGSRCTLCAACDGAGDCSVVPEDDPGCGPIHCSALSTTCRTYLDLTSRRCVGLYSCAEPEPSTCTDFVDEAEGAACACAGGEAGGCHGGECACTRDGGGGDDGGGADADAGGPTDAPAVDAPPDGAHREDAGADATSGWPGATLCGCRAASSPGGLGAAVLALVAVVRRRATRPTGRGGERR